MCLPFTAESTVEPTLAAFLLDGLMAGERCFIATTPQLSSSALGLLHRRGMPVAELLQNGTLIVTDVETYYRPTGRFVAEVSLGRAQDLIRDTRAAGFAGLRGAGGPPPWESYDAREREEFFLYEAQVGQLLHDEQVAGLCLYQRQGASPATLQAMLASHGRIVVGGRALENPLYAPSGIHTTGVLEAAFGPGSATPVSTGPDCLGEGIQTRNAFLQALGRQLGRPVARLARLVDQLERAPDTGELGGRCAGLFELAEDLDRLLAQVSEAARFVSEAPVVRREAIELGAVTAELLDSWRATKSTLPDVEFISGARLVGSWDRPQIKSIVGRMLETAWQRSWGTRIQVELQTHRNQARLLLAFEDIDAAAANPLEPGPNGASLDTARDELTLSLWAAREGARTLGGELTASVWPSGRVHLALDLPLAAPG